MTDTRQVQEHDPYVLSELTIKEPPTKWFDRLRYLGPGIILSASIVGSGELIATTTLGARAGFVTLWVIIVSCIIKVALQLEFGRHAIHTGETTMGSFNRLPGPKFGRANWSIWTWLVIMILKFIQVGGIVGGVALALNIAFPGVSVSIWTWMAAISVALLVFKGYYQSIEKISLAMMLLFTLLTIACVAFLQFTQYAVSWANILEGFKFGLPKAAVGVAIAAFGITGVGGDEIMYYNYWCIEKGYAAFTGPKKDTPDWVRRARGWIKVMYADALFSMVIYTIATAAFYLLGAAVLHGRGEIPKGFAMVEILSRMYTETLGPWAKDIFLIGAFVVLYSTLFAGLASWTRILGDALSQVGLYNFYDPKTRSKVIAVLAFLIPIAWALLFLFMKAPVLMVLIGGIGTSIMLMLVIYAAIHYRYWRLSKELTPGRAFDVWFWLSAVVIAFVGVYGIIKLIL
ncbi:MAG: Nramp family divalent metal transporter [Desulfatiglandales bacterium]